MTDRQELDGLKDHRARVVREICAVHLSYFLEFTRVGHSVLFRSERSVLFRSKKRTLHSFPFFSRDFGDL